MRSIIDWFAPRFPLIHGLLTVRLRFFLTCLGVLFVVTVYSYYVVVLAQADGLFTKPGPMIGGDFVVFRTAALAAGTTAMVSNYDMATFSAALREAYPGHGAMMVGWLYPPSMYLVVRPLSLVSFVSGFALWVGVFGALFVATVRRLWSDRVALLLAIGSPAVLQSVITGQTGLLTASLIAGSAVLAGPRPVLAGICAGLLTLKPQFGLLIPIAFAAAGNWRAFAAAAITALALAGASMIAYGIEPWLAFVEAMTAHGERMASVGEFPFQKLMTPFGAARVLGAPPMVASLFQLIPTLLLATYVAWIWRRVVDSDLRLAALATAAMLATPYGFYYEMAILVPAMLVIAKRAMQTGWLRGERLSLFVIWSMALMTPGSDTFPAFPTSFVVALGAFVIAARRTLPATTGRLEYPKRRARPDPSTGGVPEVSV